MESPTRQRQLEELDQVELCTRILYRSRNELYVNMHFLDVSLSSLGFEADWNRGGIACDGAVIYYGPGFILDLYKKGRQVINHYYLHTLFHCLFCHMYTRKGREKEIWDLACDIAMESVLDGMYEKCIHIPPESFKKRDLSSHPPLSDRKQNFRGLRQRGTQCSSYSRAGISCSYGNGPSRAQDPSASGRISCR